jgi:hypothetical protein
MNKVIITFNQDGVVTWEPMPEAGFSPEKQAGILSMAGDMFGRSEPKPEPIVSEAHASIVTQADEMKPDYSHLIGTWVRCSENVYEAKRDKWYKVRSLWQDKGLDFVEGFWLRFDCIDLTDPRDTNPDEPIEKTILFDYDRWKSGDYVRVVNGNGNEVTELKELDFGDFPLVGVVCDVNENWRKSGVYFASLHSDNSLRLVILEKP